MFAIWTFKFRENANKWLGISKHDSLYKLTQLLTTFVLVYVSWIFFRANNTGDALLIIKNSFQFSGHSAINLFTFSVDFYIAFLAIAVLLLVEYYEEYAGLYERLKVSVPRPWKWVILSVIILLVLVLGEWHGTDFLYFQF